MAEVPAEVIRRLYAAPPDRFVAARDAAVAQARQSGDPRTAREIAKLRRPTVAAWLVNLLAIRRPELVADLTQLAESLRAAQRDLRGGTLRELSAQRRAVVGALVAEVRRLAAAEPAAPPAGQAAAGRGGGDTERRARRTPRWPSRYAPDACCGPATTPGSARCPAPNCGS